MSLICPQRGAAEGQGAAGHAVHLHMEVGGALLLVAPLVHSLLSLISRSIHSFLCAAIGIGAYSNAALLASSSASSTTHEALTSHICSYAPPPSSLFPPPPSPLSAWRHGISCHFGDLLQQA